MGEVFQSSDPYCPITSITCASTDSTQWCSLSGADATASFTSDLAAGTAAWGLSITDATAFSGGVYGFEFTVSIAGSSVSDLVFPVTLNLLEPCDVTTITVDPIVDLVIPGDNTLE